jgi:hypothetical protein
MIDRQLEGIGQGDVGPCDCCGSMSRSVWGEIHRGDRTEAVYYVQWTLGRVADHGANVDLILGRWGDGTTPRDRYGVSLAFRRTDNGPAFMVIDGATRPIARSELVGKTLRRDEIMGTPLAGGVFDLVDVIWSQDDRIEEVRGGSTGS